MNLGEFGLNGGTMDAIVVEESANLISSCQVGFQVRKANVHSCNDSFTNQAPHMKLMHSQHTIDLKFY